VNSVSNLAVHCGDNMKKKCRGYRDYPTDEIKNIWWAQPTLRHPICPTLGIIPYVNINLPLNKGNFLVA
jgi:hypothetical protein